jgi:PAS domain S-box-containing protein
MEVKDMAKKSVRARSPVKKENTSPVSKNRRSGEQLKQSGSFPIVGIGASSEGHEAFKRLAENAPDVIFKVDRNLRFIFVNKKISDLTGIPKEQFYGKTLLELGLPRYFSLYLGKQAQEVFDHRNLNEFEFNFNGHEGLRWFHARIVPEFDIHGHAETALGIAHDITDLKRAELTYREERAFRDSIERSLRIGVAAVDLEGRQSYVNPSFCEMVGWSEEELKGAKPPFVYWPPEEIENITQAFQKVLSGENPTGSIEVRFQRRNGERFDALALFSPLKDGQGKLIGWIGSIGDTTEHKKKDEEIRTLNFELEQRVIERTAELDAANKRLQEAEQKSRQQLTELENIYNSAPVGLCVFDPQLTYLRINTRMAEINGVPAEDHIGRTPWEVVPELAVPAEAVLRQIIETGQPVLDVEISGETPAQPGILRTWLERWLPLKDAEGNVIGINVVAQEITERKRAEEQIKALNEDLKCRTAKLEMVNKELEAFTYSVSHDLKAPLIVASGFCRRLSERYGEELDDRGKRYLQRIQEGVQHMNLLIEDLLKLSKVTTDVAKFKSVDLSDLVKLILSQLKEKQPEREVSFLIEEGLTAKGDSRLLRIALENLLINAWKYTMKCEQAIIEFGLLEAIGEDPAYFVRDNGCGFDMSMGDKLFKPFQRLHPDEEFSGTGVGLTTVHRIITRHGGRIWAESAIGKGATFFFTLPS